MQFLSVYFLLNTKPRNTNRAETLEHLFIFVWAFFLVHVDVPKKIKSKETIAVVKLSNVDEHKRNVCDNLYTLALGQNIYIYFLNCAITFYLTILYKVLTHSLSLYVYRPKTLF